MQFLLNILVKLRVLGVPKSVYLLKNSVEKSVSTYDVNYIKNIACLGIKDNLKFLIKKNF